MDLKIRYALLTGACSAAASLFGKLCGTPISQDYLLLKIIFFALMITCNAGVCTLFVKALHSTESTLTATVISSATNYLITGLIGYLIFDEIITLIWWIGILTVMIGLMLILKDENDYKAIIITKDE